MKTIIQIAKKTKWKDVKKSLMYYYPEQRKGLLAYEQIFNDVKEYKEIPVDKKDHIIIACCFDKFDDDNEAEWYSVYTDKFAFSFRNWKELASLKVRKCNLRRQDIMAHFLWEITFNGFTQKETKKVKNELLKRVKNVKKPDYQGGEVYDCK